MYVSSNSITEASGTGSFAFMSNPGEFSIAIFKGELGGFEEPGHFFSTDEAKENSRVASHWFSYQGNAYSQG